MKDIKNINIQYKNKNRWTMKKLNNLFVSYLIAKKLKEIGFDEPCLSYHLWDGTHLNAEFKDKISQPLYSPKTNTEFVESKHIGAPLYSQVTDWLREKYKIEIIVFPKFHGDGRYYYAYECLVMDRNNIDTMKALTQGAFSLNNTYQEALDKAIEEALKLI